jgi:hypothetical protein
MSAAAASPVKKQRCTDPTNNEEAQAVLDAKAPPEKLQREINAYRFCGGCNARDALHAEANHIVTLLSTLTSTTETTIGAPDFFHFVRSDCRATVTQMQYWRLNRNRYMVMADADAIRGLFTLCHDANIRRLDEINYPLRAGHFGAAVAERIADALPHQPMDVVHLIVSYFGIAEFVNPPAANRMFRIYTDHMFRLLRAQQARMDMLDNSTQVPRHLVDVDRSATIHCMLAVISCATMIRNDPRYASNLLDHARTLSRNVGELNHTLACRHTSKQAREIRSAIEHYTSELRVEEARLCALGFQVSAVAKLFNLI